MLIIGMTGPSGAGKSRAAQYFVEHGIPSLDCDLLTHEISFNVPEYNEKIAEVFGHDVLFPDGSLNRHKLAEKVFSGEDHEEKTKLLNKTTHPFIINEIEKWLKNHEDSGFSCAIVDAPTLIESGFYKRCTVNIAILADRTTRLERLKKRDTLPENALIERIEAQNDDLFYSDKCDYVIYNDSDINTFEEELSYLLQNIKEMI